MRVTRSSHTLRCRLHWCSRSTPGPDAAVPENVPFSLSPSGAIRSTTCGAGACCAAMGKAGTNNIKSVLQSLRGSMQNLHQVIYLTQPTLEREQSDSGQCGEVSRGFSANFSGNSPRLSESAETPQNEIWLLSMLLSPAK